jgi:hypothetical protein
MPFPPAIVTADVGWALAHHFSVVGWTLAHHFPVVGWALAHHFSVFLSGSHPRTYFEKPAQISVLSFSVILVIFLPVQL